MESFVLAGDGTGLTKKILGKKKQRSEWKNGRKKNGQSRDYTNGHSRLEKVRRMKTKVRFPGKKDVEKGGVLIIGRISRNALTAQDEGSGERRVEDRDEKKEKNGHAENKKTVST